MFVNVGKTCELQSVYFTAIQEYKLINEWEEIGVRDNMGREFGVRWSLVVSIGNWLVVVIDSSR